MPTISVVIPTLNEEKYIRIPLEALKAQTYRDFEVIIADKASKDRTREIARKYGARVVIQKKAGISAGRNAGAKVAKGRILVFIDADTKPSKHLLGVYSRAFGDGTVAATGPIYALERSGTLMRLGYIFVSVLFVRASIILGQPSIVGSNFAVDAKTFRKIGGFNEKLITYEDWDLSRRIKHLGKIKFLHGAHVETSTRRVAKWGIGEYFAYHVGNMLRYRLFKSSNDDYAPIR
ncbi:MAG: glycosyltransferase [Candidatus Micrarchaeota archaeon]|nr:glycosyltransferase [Candidatus Micrarchaeota archaeon]